MDKDRILELCSGQFEDIVAIRRDLHQNPEVGFEVQRTAGVVAAELNRLGLSVKTEIGRTGVTADLEVPGASRCIALRADMDALPMQELGNPPYKSQVDGKAHMCGHDSHTAMLIGAARILVDLRSDLQSNVRFIFQPNEENLPGGAPAMIADGALEGVDEIFGLHVWPTLETGKITICEGPALAQPDVFEVTISGKGGHAAMPHQTIDPIMVASQFITAAQSIVSRSVPALDSAVVSFTQFHGGSAANVIPESVELMGTIRTFKKEIKDVVQGRFTELLGAITNAHGASFEINYIDGYPVTFNHPESVQKSRAAATGLLGSENVVFPGEPTLGGEDFSYYAERIPGCFTFLGVRNEAKGCIYPLHDPRFDLDEDAMILGMAQHVSVVLGY